MENLRPKLASLILDQKKFSTKNQPLKSQTLSETDSSTFTPKITQIIQKRKKEKNPPTVKSHNQTTSSEVRPKPEKIRI